MNRRDFITGSLMAGVGAAGCRSFHGDVTAGANVSVVIADLHIGGANPALSYTHGRLIRIVEEILAMRPLPHHVVCFGDVGLSYGLEADYAASKPILQRLVDSGIELHLTMGNHDRRSSFWA